MSAPMTPPGPPQVPGYPASPTYPAPHGTYPPPGYPPPGYPPPGHVPPPAGQPAYAPPQQGGYAPALPAQAPGQAAYAPPQGGYAPPAGGYAQAGYGPVPTQGYGVPTAAPAQVPAGAAQCRVCGSVPAADVTFRGHQGMVLMMRMLSTKGPFCRDCGLAVFRRMTERTLIQGWYGYASSIITPVTVLINLVRRAKVASLPSPSPAPNGQGRRPMDPGAPLLARPLALVGLAVPVVLVILLVALMSTSG